MARSRYPPKDVGPPALARAAAVADQAIAKLDDVVTTADALAAAPKPKLADASAIVLASGVVWDENRGTGHVSFPRDSNASFVYLQMRQPRCDS